MEGFRGSVVVLVAVVLGITVVVISHFHHHRPIAIHPSPIFPSQPTKKLSLLIHTLI